MKRPPQLPEPPRIRPSLPSFLFQRLQLALQPILLLFHLLDLRVAVLDKNHSRLRSAHRVHGHRALLRDLIPNFADSLIASGHLLPYFTGSAAPIRFLIISRRARWHTSIRIPAIRRPAASATPIAHHRNSVPRQSRHRIIREYFRLSRPRFMRSRPPRRFAQRFRRR